jgi:hypothetical protein
VGLGRLAALVRTPITWNGRVAILGFLLLFGGLFAGSSVKSFYLTLADPPGAACAEEIGSAAALAGVLVLATLLVRLLKARPNLAALAQGPRVRRAGIALGAGLSSLVLLWILLRSLFVYVEPGKLLVVKSNTGDDPAPGEILARPGEKGVQEAVLGEGLHFVPPILYEAELHDAVDIPPGWVGVVTARAGSEPPAGKILVERGEKGVWREVLPPGRYRMNPYAYTIEKRRSVLIRPGYVGFVTSLVGSEPAGTFAGPGEKGMRRDVLEPGTYHVNPYAERVDEVEVGINQVSFLDDKVITFPSADAFEIQLDATVEWELHPEDVASVVAELGTKARTIEENVLVPQAKSIGRLAGSRYGAKDFLLGEGREKFQHAFTEELVTVCKTKHLDVHSAFIRTITIPAPLLKPIQEAFVSIEKEKTAVAWEDTRRSAAELEREQALISQRTLEVTAQTDALVATIAARAAAEEGSLQAETRRAVAAKQQEIARLESSRTRLLGEARASVEKGLGESRAELLALELRAFRGDADAYRRHAFAEALPEGFSLRLVQAGPGTLWTDLEGTAGADEVVRRKLLAGVTGQ